MREYSMNEFKMEETLRTAAMPVEVLVAGSLLADVSESHGQYIVPAVRLVREIEVEYTF